MKNTITPGVTKNNINHAGLIMDLKQTNPKHMEWAYIIGAIFLIILLVGVLPSCTVVRTNYAAEAVKEGAVYYYLPKSLLKIHATAKVAVIYNADDSSLNASSRVIEQTFTVVPEIVADTKDLLSLKYKSNAVMSDEIKYGVNSKGLLEVVNITTDDRTAEIIKRLAEAPQIIFGAATSQERAVETIVKLKEFSADFQIEGALLTAADMPIAWNILVVNELGKDEFRTVAANFSISTPGGNAAQSGNNQGISSILNGSGNTLTERDGIITRPLKTLGLAFKVRLDQQETTSTLFTSIADVNKLVVIPVRRTAFARRINKINIADGVITSNEITNPSSVEGFISIPINVAKAIVSIPGQLVTFRYDNTKRLNELETERLNLEKSIQETQKFALTREQEIDKVKLDVEKSALGNEVALKTLRLELETSVLEAEKKRLVAEKALDDLKKEIEELKKKK